MTASNIRADVLAAEISRLVGGELVDPDLAKQVVDEVLKDSSLQIRATLVALVRKKLSRVFRLVALADKIEDAITDPKVLNSATITPAQMVATLREINNSLQAATDLAFQLLDQEGLASLEKEVGKVDARSYHLHLGDQTLTAMDKDKRQGILALSEKLMSLLDHQEEAPLAIDVPYTEDKDAEE